MGDRPQSLMDEALSSSREAAMAVEHQVIELASRLRPILQRGFDDFGKQVTNDSAAGKTEIAASPHVQSLTFHTKHLREISDVLSHILKNLEV